MAADLRWRDRLVGGGLVLAVGLVIIALGALLALVIGWLGAHGVSVVQP